MKPEHKRLSRMLGYCLVRGCDYENWAGFAIVAQARLSVQERVALAFACLKALPGDLIEDTAGAVLGARGYPLPSTLGGMFDARWWASAATRPELKAYAVAAFEAMSREDRRAFLDFLTDLEQAA
ncbi:hypothetical protein [Chachezhania sediminis]|uniref:hypothetical protein n=1 Tax=Chachezhania sediminis TaxID=2599291 RepID=UPI001E5A0E67|nr:hypothetical protein [Chachezhania sediminis]